MISCARSIRSTSILTISEFSIIRSLLIRTLARQEEPPQLELLLQEPPQRGLVEEGVRRHQPEVLQELPQARGRHLFRLVQHRARPGFPLRPFYQQHFE